MPAPRDALVYKNEDTGEIKTLPLRPKKMDANCGCDLSADLWPLHVPHEAKPESGYIYWPLEDVQNWLSRTDAAETIPLTKCGGLEREVRFHNNICASTRTVNPEGGALFSVELLSFQSRREDKTLENWSVLARVSGDWELERAGCLGGEKRLAVVEEAPTLSHLLPSQTLHDALAETKQVRMQLATPAVFADGWRPGWIDARSLEGQWNDVRLKLICAAVGRREAVSGWDFQTRKPKAVKWLAPAGSTYFFQVLGDTAAPLLSSWLQPVSDGAQDKRDGFGLALWGVW